MRLKIFLYLKGEKLKKYETDWVKIIDEKKYKSKKNDVLKK